MARRPRILFLGEAASLAHVVRPLSLARALDPEVYDLYFACDPRHDIVIGRSPGITSLPLRSIPTSQFVSAADTGDFPLTDADIAAYIEQEGALIGKLRPDLVVSDFGFTAAVSTELAGVTHAALANLYWSPYRRLGFDPSPKLAAPSAAALSVRPKRSATLMLNAFRRRYGLPLVQGFCEIVTRGDYTLYVDPPGLIETSPMPATSLCLGPITWSAPVAKPAWWGSWSPDLPLIYFTSGSTGDAAAAAAMVRSLAELDATVLVATSGRFSVEASPSNVYLAEYLPGAEACSEASVVVCNGGSGTVQQALASGVPVLGFWKNLDQYLSAMTVEHAGGGLACHASGVSPEQARGLVRRLLDEPVITARAKTLAQFVAAFNAQDRFRAFVRDVVA